MEYFFPLPYLEGTQPKPLPGVNAIKPPSDRLHTRAWQETYSWGEIVTRANERFGKWLPGEKWWNKDFQEACTERGVIKLFKEALEITIKIETEKEINEWCTKLFNQSIEPEAWTIRRDLPFRITFFPRVENVSYTIAPTSWTLSSTSLSPHLQNSKLIAICPDLKRLSKEFPIVAKHTANLLRDLADELERMAGKAGGKKSSIFHQQVMTSILYSWWAKRGGSCKKFPIFAHRLGISQNRESDSASPSETFSKQARARLKPETLNVLQTISRRENDVSVLRKFLNL